MNQCIHSTKYVEILQQLDIVLCKIKLNTNDVKILEGYIKKEPQFSPQYIIPSLFHKYFFAIKITTDNYSIQGRVAETLKLSIKYNVKWTKYFFFSTSTLKFYLDMQNN